MSNPEHLDKLMQGAGVWADWRAAHPEVEPDLTGAQLAGADLRDSNLTNTDLSKANLRRAKLSKCNLAGTRFAGADLTGAEFPETLSKQLDSLANVKEISSNAQKLFIALLAACLYSWLTIASTTDVNLVTNRATSSLPIIQTSIPIVGFFYVAPLLLLCTYLYFHFYLQKLWDELGSLPAIFPDGKPLYEKTDPWLLGDLVRIHSPKLKDGTPFLAHLQIWISVFLAWWVVPLTLLLFWGRYLVRHESIGTAFQAIACAAAITSAIFLYRLARNTLRGVERRPFLWLLAISQLTWVAPVATVGILAASLIVASFGSIRGVRSGNLIDNYWPDQAGPRSWLPKAMALFRFSPFADLRAAELSVKPANGLSDNGKEKQTVKGIQLSATDLQFADMRASFLRNSILTDANLQYADLLGADLEQAGMVGIDLKGASLANANLRGASLVRAILEGADIKYAHFEGAQGLTADQLRSADSWCEAFYDDAQIRMLGLPAHNNEQVNKWQLFDEENSSLGSPTTLQAAREADLRRFSPLPEFEVETAAQAAKGQPAPAQIASPPAADNSKNIPGSATSETKSYNFPGGLDGAAQTIGIIELGGGYRDQDLDKYFHDLNLKKPRVSLVPVDGHTNSPGDQNLDGQVETDIEIAGSVAPGAQIVVYFAGNDARGYLDAIRAVVQDQIHRPSVLNIGWGSPESSSQWHTDDLKNIDKVLEVAASRSITVVVASGDNGARDAATEKRLRVSFPASSPWVLSVGGTGPVPGGNSGISEVAWNDGVGATGGGVSEVFDRPKWQSNIRVPHSLSARPGRGVPDVAANADPGSGYALVIDGNYAQIGGTSIAAPMWSGLIALLNQGLGRNVGFFDPVLYQKLGPSECCTTLSAGTTASES